MWSDSPFKAYPLQAHIIKSYSDRVFTLEAIQHMGDVKMETIILVDPVCLNQLQ
jgi:hypothetical protein